MSRPTRPQWADGDPSYSLEPGAAKKTLGWLSQEKPPFQYMNWIHKTTNSYLGFLDDWADRISPTLLKSSGTATWDGSDLVLSQPLDVSFRILTGEQINRIPADTYTLSDGQVLVLKKDKTNSSPVSVALGSYGSLAVGQYVILNESSLTGNDFENETILFRRRGLNLELPINGLIYPTGSTISFGDVSGNNALYHVPIGTIIAHYDYNGDLTFDSNVWVYCDGQTAVVGGVSRTLPDASGRYLVGFGTDGGGDIDTATWATAAVGNAGHTINIQHSHTVNSHTHTGPSHTHTFSDSVSTSSNGDHFHTVTGLHALIAINPGSNDGIVSQELNTSSWDGTNQDNAGGGVSPATGITRATQVRGTMGTTGAHTHTVSVSGTTSSSGTGNTGAASPGTDSQLSATQTIQPRSIRVRYLMRKA